MNQTEGTILAWAGTGISFLTIEINPLLSAIASLATIVLSGFLIYKAILDIRHKKNLLKK